MDEGLYSEYGVRVSAITRQGVRNSPVYYTGFVAPGQIKGGRVEWTPQELISLDTHTHTTQPHTPAAMHSSLSSTSSLAQAKTEPTAHVEAVSHNRGPQCAHCSWRGSHAPTCPFK
ncbi:unnamed protein product [Mycena citricolor]|uniref:Uncharacterized protein n=1 Tax=Mycena citricolor TaxID=2018698 RepID=A0AAD2HYQ2_9AGAR|nr:unnamed protein product [Mycena citricolor]